MTEEIRKLGEEINQLTCDLRRKIMDMKNHSNFCECDDAVPFDFSNVICKGLIHTYCLNCGGSCISK